MKINLTYVLYILQNLQYKVKLSVFQVELYLVFTLQLNKLWRLQKRWPKTTFLHSLIRPMEMWVGLLYGDVGLFSFLNSDQFSVYLLIELLQEQKRITIRVEAHKHGETSGFSWWLDMMDCQRIVIVILW